MLCPNIKLHMNMSKSENELVYKIPNSDLRLGQMFRKLHFMCENQDIKDFSLTQSSLEQVFLVFARHQEVIE